MSAATMIRRSVFVLLLLSTAWTHAQSPQPERLGDSTVVAPTYAATRVIYDSAKGPVYAFSAGDLLAVAGASATEMQATFLKGEVARVVAGSWGITGKYAIEFYFRGDTLLFTYDSFEYVSGKAPPAQWRNFKQLPAWERRVFWRGGMPAFVETNGRSARLASSETNRLLRTASNLRVLMARRARELSERGSS